MDLNRTHLTPHATEQEVGLGYTYEAYHSDNQWQPRGFSLGRREPAVKAYAVWALLFSVVATVALLVRCFRARRVGLSAEGATRRLAGGLSGDEEDNEMQALLEACLELEAETNVTQQPPAPLQDRDMAIFQILQDLFGHGSEAASQQAGTSTPSPSSQATAPVQSPQPGPSRPTVGQKRAFSGSETGRPASSTGAAEEYAALEQPLPEEDASGGKRRKPDQSQLSPSSLVDQPAQAGAADASAEDPLLKALLEVSLPWSPKPMDFAELLGEAPEQRAQEEVQASSVFEAPEVVLRPPDLSPLTWSPSGQIAAASETVSLAPAASAGSPRPSTSQGLDQPLPPLLEDPLPGPSGQAPTAPLSAAPPPTGDGTG